MLHVGEGFVDPVGPPKLCTVCVSMAEKLRSPSGSVLQFHGDPHMA
jgi:hypothetical protein